MRRRATATKANDKKWLSHIHSERRGEERRGEERRGEETSVGPAYIMGLGKMARSV